VLATEESRRARRAYGSAVGRTIALVFALDGAVACAREPVRDARARDAGAGASASTSASASAGASTDAGASKDAGASTDAGADASRAAWVDAALPAFETETPMHGGPAWSFSTALPARVRTGEIAIAYASDRGISSVPNLAVRFLDARGRVVREKTLLAPREFDAALARADRRAAFEELAPTVRARIADANAALDALAPVKLTACTIDPTSLYASWPPCGADQTIACDGRTMQYLGGRQTLVTPAGRRTNAAWKKPAEKRDGYSYAVNECVIGAWLDGATLLAQFANVCAVAGDWCSVPSEWRVIALAPSDGG